MSTPISRVLLTCLYLLFFLTAGYSQAIFTTSNNGGGSWSATTTWIYVSGTDGGTVGIPDGTDNAIIANADVVDVNINVSINNLTLNGTGTVDFATPARVLSVGGDIVMNGNTTITGNGGGGGRLMLVSGNITIPAGQTGNIGRINFLQSITKLFTISGTVVFANTAGAKVFGITTMNNGAAMNATAGETIQTADFTIYDGATIDGGSTAVININGNFNVLPSVAGLHSKIGRATINVSGTTTVSGYFEFTNSASGTKTFNNTITVIAGGTWDNIIGEDPVINCSIVNNGSWPTPTGGTAQYRVLVAGTYTYSGNSSIGMTILGILSVSTVTNTTSLILNSAGTGNTAPLRVAGGTFINGNGTTGYLNFTASADVTQVGGGGSVDFSAANNTVEYSSTSNQNIYTTGTLAYYNLICSGGSTKTMPGSTIVNNALTIQTTTTVDVSGGADLTGTGNLIMNGTSTLRISSAGVVPALSGAAHSLNTGTTIEFYRGGVQTAANSSIYPYQNILISGAGGSNLNIAAVSTVLGNFTVNNQGLFNSNPVMTVGGIFTYSSASGSASTLTNNITAASFLGTAGLMNFTTNNKKMIINGDGGLWKNSGILFSGAGPNVLFTTGIGQEIQGPTMTTFGTLEIDNLNDDVTLNSIDITIATALNFTNRNIVTGTRSVIAGPSVPVAASSSTGWVNGRFRRLVNTTTPPILTFPVGTANGTGVYAPVQLTLTTVTNTVGFITVFTTDDDSPDIYSGFFEPSRTVNRYWSIINSDAATAAVAFASAAATLNFDASDPDGAINFSQASIRAYNNTTLTWANVALPTITSTATSASFTGYAGANFVQNQQLDFEIGQTISPNSVFNRVSNGTFNWSAATTWIQYRTGVIQFNGVNRTVTGTATLFTTELIVGDRIMLTTSPGTFYTISAVNSDTQFTIQGADPIPPLTAATTYGRMHIPGSNTPTTDTDAVTIGNSFLTNTSATTINYDVGVPVGGYKIATLDVNTFATPITQIQTLQHQVTTLLTIVNLVGVNQSGVDGQTTAWNIDTGTVTVQGDITIGSGSSTSNTRVAKINLTSGSLTTNNLKYRLSAGGATQEPQAVLVMGNNSTLKISGALTSNSATRGGTLTSTAGTPGSRITFNRTSGIQTLFFPTAAGSSAWFNYHSVISENTSTSGLTISTAVTSASVLGNIEVHTVAGVGALLRLTGAVNIAGAAGKSFIVAPGASFEMITSNATPFPTGFTTFDLGLTAPFGNVYYNMNGNRTLPAVNFGNIYFMNSSTGTFTANRSFTLPNSTIIVFGSATLGDGVTTNVPTLQGTGASTVLDIRNDLNVLGGTLTATNIPSIKIGGNWLNNGTFTPSTGTVEFSGLALTGNQTIGGSAASTFNNLKINPVNTTDLVQLTKNAIVTGILTLTQGGLNLVDPTDVGRTLNLTSSLTTAIARTSGYIKNEKVISAVSAPYGTVQWDIALTTGTYVFPFGKSSIEYIPFTLNKTTAGVGGTGFSVSTYATFNTANQPYPPAVVNLNGAGDSNGSGVADRFWMITPNAYTSKPTANITFTIANSERVTGNPNLNAQRWNPSNYWDPAFPVCGAGTCYTASSPTAVTINGVTNFPTPWAVTDVATPLPIELTDFTAAYRSGEVLVEWKTQTELNNDYFVVQRTTDAESFEDVVKLKGGGTTTSPRRYVAHDYQPLPGKNYYRLRQVDFDGAISYSKLIAVDVTESQIRGIYPNPSDGTEFSIKLLAGDLSKDVYIKVQDMGGNQILEQEVKNLTTSQLKVELMQKLGPGLYIISVAVDGVIIRQKLVVK